MIKTYKELLLDNSDYSNPKMRIGRLVNSKKIYKIATNVYEDEKILDPFYYASTICSPSYISFEYALYYYGMIPEKVINVTCASYKKHKTKIFKGTQCIYSYKDIPENVYYREVLINTDVSNYPFYIASKEKALLDTLYEIKGINTISGIKDLLFEDLRINEIIFYSLNSEILINIGSLYNATTLKTFIKYIKKKIKNGEFIHTI